MGGHNARPRARLPPPPPPVVWAWMHALFNDITAGLSFDTQHTWDIGVIGLFLDIQTPWVFYNQAMADVRSTCAGIECLYCTYMGTWDLIHPYMKESSCLLPLLTGSWPDKPATTGNV